MWLITLGLLLNGLQLTAVEGADSSIQDEPSARWKERAISRRRRRRQWLTASTAGGVDLESVAFCTESGLKHANGSLIHVLERHDGDVRRSWMFLLSSAFDSPSVLTLRC